MEPLLWGPCIWNTLHILTIKLKDEYVDVQIKELKEIIIHICNNLPCPICSSHAMAFINKHRFRNIKSKDELIQFIFIMHNDVNKRTKKHNFTKENLIPLYSNMKTKDVLNDYYLKNKNMNFGERMMMYSFRRKEFLIKFKKYIRSHIHCFDE